MGRLGRWWGKGGAGDAGEASDRSGRAPSAPSAQAAPGAAYADLDERVSKLLTDFEQRRFGVGPTGAVDYATCRDAVLALQEQVTDEPSRVALVRFHDALMSSGVDGLRREGRDPSELEALWRDDYYAMLVKEVVDAHGDVDQAALEHVNARESEAGRLGEGETLRIERAAPDQAREEHGLRPARAIGERAIALWTVVLRSIAPRQRETLLNAFAAEGERHWLTDAEVAFLLDEQPEHKQIVAFGWQAERLVVLLWAVGLADLPAHDERCDPIAFAALMPPTSQQPFAEFIDALQLRDPRDIGTVVEDINRSYWSAHEAEAQGVPGPDGVDLEILDERLRAAIWVLGRDVPGWP
jgi:hypothetical protein